MKDSEIKDIVPRLLSDITKSFDSKTKESKILKEKLVKLKNQKADHIDSNEFAQEIGEILSRVFRENITEERLPDGKIYYNIADRILNPNLKNNYDIINDYAKNVQFNLNKKAGIGLKAIDAEFNQNRVDGIVESVLKKDDYSVMINDLCSSVENFSRAIVDDFIEKNAEFHSKSGLKPIIERQMHGGACSFCKPLAGTYDYEEAKMLAQTDPKRNPFARHRFCRCTVDYLPGNGKRQDVWSKKWKKVNEDDKIKKRIELSNKTNFSINSKQFGKKSNKHMKDYGLDVSSKADRKKFVRIINDIVDNHDSVIRNLNWRGQTNTVIAYVKGKDVVLVDKNNEFITILKGGINNARIKNARKQ